MTRAALVGGCIGLVMGTACTVGGDPVTGPSVAASGSVSTPVPSAPTPTVERSPGVGVPTDAFEEGDAVLRVAVTEPSTLDPMRINDSATTLVARQLYEGLTRWDPVHERVRGAAAESWQVRDQGATFAFRLRAGMTFHNGAPVTSGSFQYAFDRLARRSNASDLAYVLDEVKGFHEVNRSGASQSLSGISTPDPLTLVIRLSRPYNDFPAVLTHPGLVPLDRRALRDEESFIQAPVGNGPFKMAKPWSPGDPVVLEAFDGFTKPPRLDGIVFLPYPDAASSWLLFANGDLDVAEVPADEIEAARRRYGEAGFKPLLGGYSFAFNLRAAGVSKLKVRKAINHAIDRERLSATVYKGTIDVPRGVVQRGMPGFQVDLCVRLCRYTPKAARRVVATIPRRQRELSIHHTREPPHRQVARFVRANLEAVGFRVKTKALGFKDYLRLLRSGRHSMYQLGWFSEYPVPDVLAALFSSTSPDNHTGFSSSRVDRLLSRAERERSPNVRSQLYLEAEEAILRDAPLVPIGSFSAHWAAQEHVRGFLFDTMGGFDAAGISLSGE